MLGLGILSLMGVIGVAGFHMVRPNFRDIRVSMAHLMPTPPVSQAPKRKFSLRSLITSRPFWLRLVCVSLVALALYPQTIRQPAEESGSIHFRLVLDVSGSMGIAEQRSTRLEDGLAVAADVFARMIALQTADASQVCMDLVTVAGTAVIYGQDQISMVLDGLVPQSEGGSVGVLTSAPSLPGQPGCAGPVTHVVFVTDQPQRPIPSDAFSGHILWHQVGNPQDNLAIWDVALTGGGLRDAAPELDLRVAGFGAAPTKVLARIEAPGGSQQISLRRDESRAGGWRADVPVIDAGPYQIMLMDGAALPLDDRVAFTLGQVKRITVDWQLPNLPRPAIFAEPKPDPERTAITVAPYTGPDMALPEGPFVLTYQGWPVAGMAQIGPFMRDHPVLEAVNLDVLEAAAPRPQIINDTQMLNAVIRPSGRDGVWVAIRDSPRGVLVPAADPTAGDTAMTLSRLLFFNALSWVAEGDAPASLNLTYLDPDGRPVANAIAESNTAALVNPPPDLGLLAQPPLPPDAAASDAIPIQDEAIWAPWLFVFALAILLLERLIGLIWSSKGRADV
jgi:hypothetical protein